MQYAPTQVPAPGQFAMQVQALRMRRANATRTGGGVAGWRTYCACDAFGREDRGAYCCGHALRLPGRVYDSPEYRYGCNGQERDDEVAGTGNSNTAEFWQYDTRLGRRWNRDPRPNVSGSEYATFGNNPILFIDYRGDTTAFYDISSETLLGTINDEGSLKRIKIDARYYNYALEQAAKAGKSITDEENANEFVLELSTKTEESERYLNQGDSENDCFNIISCETGEQELRFDGNELSINALFDDGSDLEIASYAAHSGARDGAERILNGNFRVDGLIYDRRDKPMMIRDGVGFSMDIEGRGPVWDPDLDRNRTLMEIHPDGQASGRWRETNGTDGCIGLQTDAARLNDFRDRMRSYMEDHEEIRLIVDY